MHVENIVHTWRQDAVLIHSVPSTMSIPSPLQYVLASQDILVLTSQASRVFDSVPVVVVKQEGGFYGS